MTTAIKDPGGAVRELARPATPDRVLAAALDQVPVGIIVAERPGMRIRFMNAHAAELLGAGQPGARVEDGVEGLTIRDSLGVELAPGDWPLARALSQGATTVDEQFTVERDGARREVRSRASPVRDEAGHTIAAVATVENVTDQAQVRREREALERELEDAFRRARSLAAVTARLNAGLELPEVLRAALTSAAEALGGDDGSLFLFDADGRHLRGAFELFDRERIGVVADVAAWPNHERALESGRAAYITSAEALGDEVRWFQKLGIAATLVAPLVARGRALGLLFVNYREQGYLPPPEHLEFAESLAAQCAVAIERAAAYENARREAWIREMLMAALGHDLRNPLGVITASATYLRKHAELEGEGAGALQRVSESAWAIEGMLQDLLDFARVQRASSLPVCRAPVDLLEVVEEAVRAHRDAGGSPVALEAAAGDYQGLWDGDRMRQLVTHLLGNARKHGAPGAEVCVRLTADETRVALEVENEGDAIPPTLLPFVFEPFRRGTEKGRADGLGLGLFLVREIVRAHGGDVTVHSMAGAPTCFRVSLPRESAAVATRVPR